MRNRPKQKTFRTDDGYLLRFDPERRIWTDGNLVFQADEDGNPLDTTGKWLEGLMRGREDEPKLGRIVNPQLHKADHAGSCYLCGYPIYAGDKIRMINDNTYTPPITKACHEECS